MHFMICEVFSNLRISYNEFNKTQRNKYLDTAVNMYKNIPFPSDYEALHPQQQDQILEIMEAYIVGIDQSNIVVPIEEIEMHESLNVMVFQGGEELQ